MRARRPVQAGLFLVVLASLGTCSSTSAQPAAVGPRVLDIAKHKQDGRVDRLAFSPDGSVLAVMGYLRFQGSGSEVLTLWSVPTGRHLRTLHGDGASDRFEFSPDGKLLATPIEQAGEVVLWDVATGQEVRRLKHPSADEVKFSPAGKHLFTSNWPDAEAQTGGELRVWEFETGKQVYSTPWDAKLSSTFAQFAADGRLFFGDTYSRVRCWDPATGTVRPPVRFATAAEVHLGLSPTGDLVTCVSGKNDRLRLRDAATGKIKHDLGKGWVNWTEFTRDGKLLFVGREGRVEVRDTATGALRSEFKGPEHTSGGYPSGKPLPDGRHVLIRDLFLGSDGSGVYLNTAIYTMEGKLVRRLPDVSDLVMDRTARSIAVLSRWPTAAEPARDRFVTLYDAAAWLGGGKKD